MSCSQFTHASYDAEMQIQTIELVFMLSGSKLLYQLSCWQFTRALYNAEVQIQTIELVFVLSGIKLFYQLSCSQLTYASYDAEMQIQTIQLRFMLSRSKLLNQQATHNSLVNVTLLSWTCVHVIWKQTTLPAKPLTIYTCFLWCWDCRFKPSNLCSCYLEVNCSTS